MHCFYFNWILVDKLQSYFADRYGILIIFKYLVPDENLKGIRLRKIELIHIQIRGPLCDPVDFPSNFHPEGWTLTDYNYQNANSLGPKKNKKKKSPSNSTASIGNS